MSERFVSGVSAKIALYKCYSFPFLSLHEFFDHKVDVIRGRICQAANPTFLFYRVSSYASSVLGVVILSFCLSIRPSVRLSVTRVLDTTRKDNHSSCLTLTVVGGRRPLTFESCAQSDKLPPKNADFDIFALITRAGFVRGLQDFDPTRTDGRPSHRKSEKH